MNFHIVFLPTTNGSDVIKILVMHLQMERSTFFCTANPYTIEYCQARNVSKISNSSRLLKVTKIYFFPCHASVY